MVLELLPKTSSAVQHCWIHEQVVEQVLLVLVLRVLVVLPKTSLAFPGFLCWTQEQMVEQMVLVLVLMVLVGSATVVAVGLTALVAAWLVAVAAAWLAAVAVAAWLLLFPMDY